MCAARRPRRLRSALISLLVPLGTLTVGCSEPPQRDLLRLTDLAIASPAEARTLARDLRLQGKPTRLDVEIPAARLTELVLRARGTAQSLELDWKIGSEPRFRDFRSVSVPLDGPPGEATESVVRMSLAEEPQWVGNLDAIRLRARGGWLEVASLEIGPPAGARSASISGRTLPTFPGLTRLELQLPTDAPRKATLEVELGVAPLFDKPGTVARFRIRAVPEDVEPAPDRGVAWLDRTVEGDGTPGWEPVRIPVEVPPGGRVLLETEVHRKGRSLPEGVAFWGAPILVRPDPPDPKKPDLVVILVDTLRADVLGAWGNHDELTPNLDRLARRSVRLDQLHSPAPWTLPTVASLLTGLQPQSHGAGLPGTSSSLPTPLGSGPTTLSQRLTRRGFYTAGVYRNTFLEPSFGVSRGFDLYERVIGEDDARVDRAIEILERIHGDRRFFLLLHLFGPHNPYVPPGDACDVARRLEPEYAAASDGTGPAKPADPPAPGGNMGCRGDRRPGLPVPPAVDRPWFRALYEAEVAYTDAQIGRFLDAIDRLGLADRIVLVMLSDHGEDLWNRLEQLERYGYYQGDHGHHQFEDLVRVPGMIRAPDLAPGVVNRPVETVDLLPTMLGLLDLDTDGEGGAGGPHTEDSPLQGLDLSGALRSGEDLPELSRRLLVSDVMLYGRRWSVRRGPWKLVVPEDWQGPGSGDVQGQDAELYDLEHDPGETTDVAGDHPDIVASLWDVGREERGRRRAVLEALQGGEDTVRLDKDQLRQLRALGYLQ